uniref:Uncharacterized protein n=1 Tax=Romanomermis culicivorax TaxID=13658 RepID=A0A915L5Q2_ROMCU
MELCVVHTYNHQQIVRLLENRSKDCLVANKEVLECKVSALSRGLRRALEICRLSYDIYRQNANKNNKKKKLLEKRRLSRKTVEIMVDRVNSYPCPKWTIRDAEQTIKQFNSSIEVTAI